MGRIKNFLQGSRGKNYQKPWSPLVSIRSTANNIFSSLKNRQFTEEYRGWVYTCTKAIAEEVSAMSLHLERSVSGGDAEEVTNHPALQALERANDMMTKQDLFEATQSYLELVGDCFWLLEREGNQIVAIWPVNPNLVEVIREKTEKGGEMLAGYAIKAKREKIAVAKEDMIHFKTFNPLSPWRGIGSVQAAIMAIDTDMASRIWNLNFFENGARPDGVLEYTGNGTLTKEQAERISSKWNEEHGSMRKAHKTAVLANGLTYKPINVSQAEMDFIEQRRFSRDEILSMFRVPKTVIGITEDVNRANAEASDFVFAARTIKPKMSKIVNTLNEFYLPLFPGSEGLKFTFEDPTPEDREKVLASYNNGINNGWMSPNDVRRSEGLPELQNGDATYLPINMVPVGRPAPVQEEAKSKSGIKAAAKEIAEMAAAAMKNEEFERRGEALWKATQQRVATFEQKMTKTLYDQFQKQLEVVKEGLPTLNQKAPRQPEDLLDKDAEVQATVDLLTPILKQLQLQEGQEALEFLGFRDFDYNTDEPSAAKFLDAFAKKMAVSVVDETIRAYTLEIKKGLDNDEDLAAIRQRLEDNFAFQRVRADKIARTETTRFSNFSTQDAWEKSGVVQAKIWYTSLDERVCPYCGPMHGKEIGLSENYFTKGDEFKGDAERPLTLGYSNVDAPPLHPSCRCTILPVLTTKSVNNVERKTVIETKEMDDVAKLYYKTLDVLSEYESDKPPTN